MTNVGYIAVKDFDHFQHYKSRTPPWIKLYNALLDDYRFLQLSDAARSQLVLIWLVASRHRNRIPNDPKYITEAIHCTTKLRLEELLASGWLYLTNDAPLAERTQDASKDASTPQAKRPQNAPLEGEREVETEIETTTTPLTAREELLSRVPERRQWEGEMSAILGGMPGHYRATEAQLERACRDMLANGKGKVPNLRQFRRYVEGAINEKQNGTRLSVGEQSYRNARTALEGVK